MAILKKPAKKPTGKAVAKKSVAKKSAPTPKVAVAAKKTTVKNLAPKKPATKKIVGSQKLTTAPLAEPIIAPVLIPLWSS